MMKAQAFYVSLACMWLLCSNAITAQAFPNNDLNPFPADVRPVPVSVHEFPAGIREMEDEATGVESMVFRDQVDGQDVVLRLRNTGAEMLSAELQIDGVIRSSRLPGTTAGRWFIGVDSADLNSDGTMDFMINQWNGGCGRAAGGQQIAFLLSLGEGYRSTMIATAYAQPENYVTLDGKPCFIHTADEGLAGCRDGFGHDFYVHNILAFAGGEVRLDNFRHPGFPLIQWDQNAIDHNNDPRSFDWKEPFGSETALLSDEQKRQLLSAVQAEIFLKPGP